MPLFRIIAHGESHEVYEFWAENEEAARARWEEGIDKPMVSEVEGSEIHSVEEVDS